MNLAQITKKYEDYKKGLEQDLHKLDDIKKEVSEELFLIKTETLKSPEKIKIESGQTIEEWGHDFEEFYKSAIFPISCILPLQTVIAHFSTKINTLFSSKEINMELDPIVPSSREIYRIIKQLPEEIVSFALDGFGTNSLINVYKEGEESFTSAFELLTNKSEIKDELVLFVKLFDLGSNVEQVFHINDENTFEAVKFYLRECMASVKEHPDLENTNALFDAFGPDQYISIDHNTSRMSIDSQRHIDYYKRLLLKYIKISPNFDLYTQQCADNILQHPDYIDFNNKLLIECEAILRKETVEAKGMEFLCSSVEESRKRGNGKTEKPFPLPFPEHLGITDKKEQLKFLENLFNKLAPKFFAENTRLDIFQYLLGGGDKPNDYRGERIVWKGDFAHVQIFYVCYYDIDVPNKKSYDWEPLKKIFFIKGRKDVSSNGKKNVENPRYSEYFKTFENYITNAKPI